jgi:hypothetical protein
MLVPEKTVQYLERGAAVRFGDRDRKSFGTVGKIRG